MKIWKLATFILAVFLSSNFAWANQNEEKANEEDIEFRYTYFRVNYSLNPDGENEITYDIAFKLLKESALDELKDYSVSFSTSVEHIEMISAYSVKPDGSRRDVPESNFQKSVNSGLEKDIPPAFSDWTTLSFVFPDFAVGDTAFAKYKITQKQQFFPKQFSTAILFPRQNAYDEILITLDAPASMPLRFETPFLTESKNSEANGRIQREWKYSNPEPTKGKKIYGTVFKYGDEPGFIVSSFESYEQIATAYGKNANEKAKVTERVKKLAKEVTSGKRDKREIVNSLYDWVSKNIGYAGNCIGVGAVVPRDLDFVLDNKMGDCKDHATLLQALLTAKDIESTQALINSGSNYELPKVPLVSAINHVINYVPSLDLFLDSTAPNQSFGTLPSQLVGKPVLLVHGYKEGLSTPKGSGDDRTSVARTTLKISANGSAKGETEVLYRGQYAAMLSAQYKNLTDSVREKIEESMLEVYRYRGKIQMTLDPKNTEKEYRIVIRFDIENFRKPGKARGTQISPLFGPPLIHKISGNLLLSNKIEGEFPCSATKVEEVVEVVFPKNISILGTPESFYTKNDYIEYRADYSLNGNTFLASRTLDDVTPGPICGTEVAKAYREIGLKINDDLDAQLVTK